MRLAELLVAPIRGRWTADLLALFLRVALAAPFWLSGRTKIEEGTFLTISDTTYFLFENEYSNVPMPADVAAVIGTIAEHLLPFLLVIGLGTRVAAAGLIVMTCVIQLFVYPDAWWNVHMQWVGLGIAVLALGPSRLSLDFVLFGDRRW